MFMTGNGVVRGVPEHMRSTYNSPARVKEAHGHKKGKNGDLVIFRTNMTQRKRKVISKHTQETQASDTLCTCREKEEK